jgi:F-type H+-transporting ATPase subunit b
MEIVRQLASTHEAAADNNIVSVLGIDWMMLLFQVIAFLILVWLLGKYVYPWLLKSVDERQDKIEASVKAATEAQSAAADAEKKVAKILGKARAEADDIIATAKAESIANTSEAEEKSRRRAEQIVSEAQTQIEKEVALAKKALCEEMVDLVALATEKVTSRAVSQNIDNSLIAESIKEVK